MNNKRNQNITEVQGKKNMKLKRSLHDVTTDEDNKIPLEKPDHSPIHNFVALSACAALAMIFILLIQHLNSSPVYRYITVAIL